MPQLNTVQITRAMKPNLEAEIIKQAEAGYKYASGFHFSTVGRVLPRPWRTAET